VVNIIVPPVFDLGRSFGNVKSGKSPENVLKNSGNYIRNCVGTLQNTQFNSFPFISPT